MNVPLPVLWEVVVPGEQRYRVVGHNLEEAVQLVAAQLNRRARLIPRFVGERGSVWFVTVEGNETVVAPTVFLEAA
jgi:hypothetical protein